MKRLISIILLAAFCISLAACQPTPDEPFVVNKGDGKLLEIINGKPAPALSEPYQVPENWTETFKGKAEERLTVEIDAEITVPDVLEYPVYEAIYEDYNQESFDRFLSNAVGDVELFTVEGYTVLLDNGQEYEYPYRSTNEAQRFLDAIDYQLNDQSSPLNKYFIPECRSHGSSDGDSAVQSFLKEQGAFDYILKHQSDLMTKVDKQYSSVSDDRDTWTYWFTGDGNSKIYINRKMNEMCTLGYETDSLSTGLVMLEGESRARTSGLKDMIMDVHSAQVQADAYLERFGLKDWQLVNIGSTRMGTIDEVLMGNVYLYGWGEAMDAGAVDEYEFYDIDLGNPPEAYLFTYTPSQSGIPSLYFSNKQENDYSNRDWFMPCFQIAVDDSGVRAVSLVNGNSHFGECLNTNVELLPFEKIQQKFRDYITISPNYSGRIIGEELDGSYEMDSLRDYTGHEMTRIHIDDIRLGYIKVRKINSDEYMLIPAWCFYGQEYNRFSDESQFIRDENNEARLETSAGHSFLCINAIDGSIIDLTKGY